MIVLDTNVVSELMRSSPDPSVAEWFQTLDGGSLATTSITVAEIAFGLARLPAADWRQRLESGFADLIGTAGPLPVLEFSADAAFLAGQIRARREAQGKPVVFADSAIAGLCLAHGASLATRNLGDFEGLSIRLLDSWTGLSRQS